MALQFICSYVLWPLTFLMGVEAADCRKVAELIGVKIFVGVFYAYQQLSLLTSNRENLERHVLQNGTWTWSGYDVILIYPGRTNTVLTNGVISVLIRSMF